MQPETRKYNSAQSAAERRICDLLAKAIDTGLKGAKNKIWHGHPVWFLDGNPIVGYSKVKAGIRLMFWSGADFREEKLVPGRGKFKDASIVYTSVKEVSAKDLKRWLKKSRAIQWDYKNIVKRKGKLVRLPAAADAKKKPAGPDERIAALSFGTVYPLYLAKAVRKGRTQAELDAVITWLTGLSTRKIHALAAKNITFADLFAQARLNPNARLITGIICGVRVEEIRNPLTQKVRYLDKLVDELAKGKSLENILRSE
jgi:hypothetical protein